MNDKFSAWALVELFGHTRIAGLVTEESIAGGAMVRIDVPETESSAQFTRIVNITAIYAINPITEDLAREMARNLRVAPIQAWDIKEYVSKMKIQLPGHEADPEAEF
jgi:hypothetical protein